MADICERVGCSNPITQPPRGRRRSTCSGACRWTKNKAACRNEDEAAPKVKGRCIGCGQELWDDNGGRTRCTPCYGILSHQEEIGLAPTKGCFNCAAGQRDTRCDAKWRCTSDEAMICKPWVFASRHKPKEAVSA